MFDEAHQILDKITNGIAVIDTDHKVVFWNTELSKLSKIPKEAAIGRNLCEVCPKFLEKRYQEILENLFAKGQSRFCSSTIHKAFFVPEDRQSGAVYQNLNIDPVIKNGRVEYAILQITDVTENVQKQKKLQEIIANLKQDFKVIKDSENEAKKRAAFDPLTGILNRLGFEQELSRHAGEINSRLVIFFIDLDGFKTVNDTYGHVVGDVLLQQVAGRLKNNTRQCEDRPKDIIARLGGDEFVIALINVAQQKDIISIAEKIVYIIRKPFYIDQNMIEISSSLGIAIYPDDCKDFSLLVELADQAMYRIKQAGKNNYGFYNPKHLCAEGPSRQEAASCS